MSLNQRPFNACVSELISKTGQIDVLVNNAGVGITGPLEEIPTEEMKRNFETNLFGPINMINAVLPYMRDSKIGINSKHYFYCRLYGIAV